MGGRLRAVWEAKKGQWEVEERAVWEVKERARRPTSLPRSIKYALLSGLLAWYLPTDPDKVAKPGRRGCARTRRETATRTL